MLLTWRRDDVGLVHVVPVRSPGRVLLRGKGLGAGVIWDSWHARPSRPGQPILAPPGDLRQWCGSRSPRRRDVTAGLQRTLRRVGTGADEDSLSFNLWLLNGGCSALALLVSKAALSEESEESVTLGQMHAFCSKYIFFFPPRAF